MNEHQTDFILTRREAAAKLRICLRTLTRLEQQKRAPPRIRRSDRLYGYRNSDIEKFLTARTAV